MSIRDTIAASNDLRTTPYEVPEWGVTVNLVTPTLEERDSVIKVLDALADAPILEKNFAVAASLVVHDPETGAPLFTSVDDARGFLRGRNAAVVERLAQECIKVAGLGDVEEQVEEGKADSTSTLVDVPVST